MRPKNTLRGKVADRDVLFETLDMKFGMEPKMIAGTGDDTRQRGARLLGIVQVEETVELGQPDINGRSKINRP